MSLVKAGLTSYHSLQIFAKRGDGNAALRAVDEFAVAVEIEAERQCPRVSHVARADCFDLRFRMIAIGSETHKMIVEQRGDGGLRDNALNEGAAVPSSVTPVFDEDKLPFALCRRERIGQSRVPAHRAAIIEMRVRTFACVRHLRALLRIALQFVCRFWFRVRASTGDKIYVPFPSQ